MVTIKFEKGEWPLILSDALLLTDEEVATLTKQDIEAMKEERYQQWLVIMTAPPENDEAQEQIVEEGPIDG